MVRRMGVSLRPFERFVITAIVVLIALATTSQSFGQTSTATILGVVKDASGALIPGVSIAVKHTESGLTRTAISSERGAYSVTLLPVGAYELTTTRPGVTQQATVTFSPVQGSGCKPTVASLMESTGLAETPTASTSRRKEPVGNCWAWRPSGNSTFSRPPTAPSMGKGPEDRSTL